MRTVSVSITAIASLLLLSACSFSASLTVPADSVAKQAADALEKQTGSRPDIDCGDDDVKLVDGTVVDCVIEGGDTDYDATVTISNVKGTKYSIDVQVADTPKGGAPESSSAPSDTPTPTATDTGADSGTGALTVYPYELAKTAAKALEPQYGALPTVVCEGDALQISVGTSIDCKLTEAKTGAQGIATITITSISGTNYSINVKVADA